MSRTLAISICAVTAIAATAVVAQDSILAQVETLWHQARYTEATDLIERSTSSSPEQSWWAARLATDPARFQEVALMIGQDPAAPDGLQRESTFARAREHFAAGRYQSAEGLFRPFAESGSVVDTEAILWWGMRSSSRKWVTPCSLISVRRASPYLDFRLLRSSFIIKSIFFVFVEIFHYFECFHQVTPQTPFFEGKHI